ncbi:MAG: hypothetical protein AAB458_00145 [Patescibacteria group bacterium]
MTTLGHVILFLTAAGVVWFFAGILIESIDRVAKRFHKSGFTVAFFVLGFLTSISEISVMVNSTLTNTPEISAGNLIGASFVILLGIVPLLAIVGGGIKITHTLSQRHLAYALFVVVLPVFFVLDGIVTLAEGVISLLVYITTLYLIRGHHTHTVNDVMTEVGNELTHHETATLTDGLKIIVGTGIIFVAGHYLVSESIFFSELLSIPSSIIGLVLLSIGTNVPEIVIAVRSVLKRKADIAFGDYLGSALTNTLIFAILPMVNGNFSVGGGSQFIGTAVLMSIGFVAFYHLTKSGRMLSRHEGHTLLILYFMFIAIQLISVIHAVGIPL